MEGQRPSSEHKFEQLPFQAIGLVCRNAFVKEGLKKAFGNAHEFEIVVDVERVRLEVHLHCVADAALFKELVAVRDEVVEGVLQQQPLLLLCLVLLQEALERLEHQLAVPFVKVVVFQRVVLLKKLFVPFGDLRAVLLVKQGNVPHHQANAVPAILDVTDFAYPLQYVQYVVQQFLAISVRQ